MVKIVLGSVVLAIVAAGGGLAFMYSGLADVAATSPHWALTRWIAGRARSARFRARGSPGARGPCLHVSHMRHC